MNATPKDSLVALMRRKQLQRPFSATTFTEGSSDPGKINLVYSEEHCRQQNRQEPATKRPRRTKAMLVETTTTTATTRTTDLSSSRSDRASGQRGGTKRVTFNAKTDRIHLRTSFTEEEFRACWLSTEELLEIRKAAYQDIDDFRSGILPLYPDRTIRGLEVRAVMGMSRFHMLKIHTFRSSVIERQGFFSGLPATGDVPNPLSVGTFSETMSADDCKKAIEIAAADAKEAMLDDDLC